jgi:glucose-1-phosphate cytidylyltransferase
MESCNIPVVILAGGLGTRLKEETEFRPKPMVPIGGKPILWHIMKTYSHYGFNKFIICLGYKGEMIKEYFLNYHSISTDCTINTKSGKIIEHGSIDDEFEITLVDTGKNCMTGGRVARIENYIKSDKFFLTYGDGLADVDIQKLLEFHNKEKKLVTLTGVNLLSRFGNLEISGNTVSAFKEKTRRNEWINSGFMVCQKEFFQHLSTDPGCILEKTPLSRVAENKNLAVYKHNGFWHCMDTIRDHESLEKHWRTSAPWKVWNDQTDKFCPAQKSAELF